MVHRMLHPDRGQKLTCQRPSSGTTSCKDRLSTYTSAKDLADSTSTNGQDIRRFLLQPERRHIQMVSGTYTGMFKWKDQTGGGLITELS